MRGVIVNLHMATNDKIKCRRCSAQMYRISRPAWAKTLLFFLPLKRYFCDACLRKRWRF